MAKRSSRSAKRRRAIIAGGRVYLRKPVPSDQAEYLKRMRDSRALHNPWQKSLTTPRWFARYMKRSREKNRFLTLVCRCEDDAIVGAVNLNEISRGNFQSAYLGYYAFVPYDGEGYMTEGVALMVQCAFTKMKLHRVEAGIRPGNVRSLRLIKRLGFRREGLAKLMIKENGAWHDSYRFAMTVEDWRVRKR